MSATGAAVSGKLREMSASDSDAKPGPLEPPRPGLRPAAGSAAGSVPAPVGTLAPESPRDPEEHVRAALEASTRAEATLSALMRAVQQVTTGVSGAQEANEKLASELGRVREMLASANEQRLALKNRVQILEDELRRSERALRELRAEAERDRSFLMEEQDRFLAALLEEHERELAKLRRELDEGRASDFAAVIPSEKKTLPGLARVTEPQDPGFAELRAELDRLLTERDRSRDLLRRVQMQRDDAQRAAGDCARERDEARAEVARLSAQLEAPPEVRAQLHAQDARISTLSAESPGRRTDPGIPLLDLSQRATSPPPQGVLEAALVASRQPSPPGLPLISPPPAEKAPIELREAPPRAPPPPPLEDSGSRPPPVGLLRRQDPLKRPVGGYSLKELEEEHVDDKRRSSKPPR